MPATAKKKKPVRTSLREDITLQRAMEVDAEKGIVTNVKILGWKSKNKNRKYNPNGVTESMYEGVACNMDHPDPEKPGSPTPVTTRFGWFEGVYKSADGLFAKTFRFNPKHHFAESFVWWCKNNPSKLGFSQNAVGDVIESDLGETVERVTEVRSVDLVSDPATTKGIHEHVILESDEPEEITEEDDENPLEDADPDDDDTTTTDDDIVTDEDATDDEEDPTEDEGTVDTGSDSDISSEMVSAATKIFLDTKMDPKTKLVKIKALLMMHHDMKEGVAPATLEQAKKNLLKYARRNKSVAMVLESLDAHQVREQRAKRMDLAKKLCKSANLPDGSVTAFFLESLVQQGSERKMLAAIEDRRAVVGTKSRSRPTSHNSREILLAGEIQEGDQGDGDGTNKKKQLTEAEQKARLDEFEARVLASDDDGNDW